jgi:hypothetical protein
VARSCQWWRASVGFASVAKTDWVCWCCVITVVLCGMWWPTRPRDCTPGASPFGLADDMTL